MLEVVDLSASYRGVLAVRDITLSVPDGKTVALLGPNGAGKSTAMLCIAGAHKPDYGVIELEGADVSRLSPQRRVERGMALVPEGRYLFPELTVTQNLNVGFTGTGRTTRSFRAFREWIFELFPPLAERRSLAAGSLSGGEQQMLAVARALASEPKLLMLDEPSLGLAPPIVAQVYGTLRVLIETTDISILLVEQYADKALRFADFAYILRNGRVVASGDAEELRSDEALVESYLGGV